jgi:hypothetical protein
VTDKARAIERIRAEVQGILAVHGQDHPISTCQWCILAEDKLKLAYALEAINFDAKAQPDGKARPPIGYIYIDEDWPVKIDGLLESVSR